MITTHLNVQVFPKDLPNMNDSENWHTLIYCLCMSAFTQCLHSSSHPSILQAWDNMLIRTPVYVELNSLDPFFAFTIYVMSSLSCYDMMCVFYSFPLLNDNAHNNSIACVEKHLPVLFCTQSNAAVAFLSLQCLQQYVQLAIMEGGGAPITCPDMACQKTGVLLDSEVCPAKTVCRSGRKTMKAYTVVFKRM